MGEYTMEIGSLDFSSSILVFRRERIGDSVPDLESVFILSFV
jgi:hypothetical protein